MTKERTEEIRRAAEAATSGPWEAGPGQVSQTGGAGAAKSVATGVSPADAAFIAISRMAVPELLEELVEQRVRGHGDGQKYVMHAVSEALGWPDLEPREFFARLRQLRIKAAAT